MTNKKALQLIQKQGFATEMSSDGHIIVRDETGMVVGKLRNHGEAHMSLTKWIAAGFPKRPPSIDRYVRLQVPGVWDEGELLFWTDD